MGDEMNKRFEYDGRKYELLTYPDTRLHHVADYVHDDMLDEALIVARDMVQIMRELKGQGLAATQLGLNMRVFVMQTANMTKPALLANMHTTYESTMDSDDCFEDEGCLSLPGETISVPRPYLLKIYAVDLERPRGKMTRGLLEGIEARVFMHELDHLNGRLINHYTSAWRDHVFNDR